MNDPSLSGPPEASCLGLPEPTADTIVVSRDRAIEQLSALVSELDDRKPSLATATKPEFLRFEPDLLRLEPDNCLVQVRLGIASGLFRALSWKHEPTALHSLRVTFGLSHWASQLRLTELDRDELELAALLHDVGKLGVPDSILMKAGPLTPQESAVMDGSWTMGQDILRASCASQNVLAIVSGARRWYDGSRGSDDHAGAVLPVGARMLSIADAFDSMMSDQIYRRALPRERAFHELYRCAGTQFDPDLVRHFEQSHECDHGRLRELVGRRWLSALESSRVNEGWFLDSSRAAPSPLLPESLFQEKLLANMYDAVVFIDSSLRVIHWNRGAERLTGLSEPSMTQKRWQPSVLEICDEHGTPIRDDDCPMAHAIVNGLQWMRRMIIRGRNNRRLAVDVHAVPVVASTGVTYGLALLLHDASPEISLEERCVNLHELATRDPLTQVANRAEFDRAHVDFVAVHLQNHRPCSLIICDIDRFKRVNDTFGHQAGDEVIQSFARLLASSCRPGDLVARYGGEEFVVLCADCDNAAAVRRAEELRQAFSQMVHPPLEGGHVTASFGVTEIQPGDVPETMLRRADRALLNAKEGGRNRVVQLGIGTEGVQPTRRWHRRQKGSRREVLIQQHLISEAPLAVCVEKLRGFVADHFADIVKVDGKFLRIQVPEQARGIGWNVAERPLRMFMDIELEEGTTGQLGDEAHRRAGTPMTRLHVSVHLAKSRDRRQKRAAERARQLLISFKAYLMARESEETPESSVLGRAKGMLSQWWSKDKS